MYTEESLKLQNDLLNTLVNGGGLKEVIGSIARFVGQEVLITSPSHRILHSTLYEPGFNEGDFLKVTLLNPPVPGRVQIQAGAISIEALAIELSHAAKRLGFLLICNPGLDEDNRLKILIHQARNICVLELQKQAEIIENSRYYQDAFLFDLLYGNMEENEDIIVRAKTWNWDFTLPHLVTVFELEDYEPYSQDHHTVTFLKEIAQGVMESLNKPVIIMDKNEEVILILPIEEKKRQVYKAYLNMIISQVLSQVAERLAPRVVRVGVGRKYDQPTEIFRSYQEAKVAVKLSALLKDKGPITYFRELGVERILYSHDKQELLEFYREILSELEAQDKQKNELIDTLENYLTYHCDLKATANALFLHPNSLRYRLKRIEEILEIDIQDFDTIVSLVIAFKIKHLVTI